MWKTLCPFWGEEYQVHLPPTFHSVAFYVMDEDALRWVGPHSSAGAQGPPSAPPGPSHRWDCRSLCILFMAWHEGESRRVWKGSGFEHVGVCGDGGSSPCSPRTVRMRVQEYKRRCTGGCELEDPQSLLGRCGHMCPSMCRSVAHAHERVQKAGPAGGSWVLLQ